MQEEIYKTLRKKRKKFYKSIPGALKFKDPEDVHQLRVAGRTVLALVDLMADNDDLADKRFKKMRRSLKKAMGQLGRLRDADVMIDEIGEQLPAMTPAQRYLLETWLGSQEAARKKLRKKIARKLPDIIDAKWKKRMLRWQRTKESSPEDVSLLPQKLHGLRESRAEAFQAIRDSLPERISLDDTDFLNALHRGRIATKKLRYALESLPPSANPDEDEIRRLKTVQDRLGHIQDLRIWGHKLESAEGDRGVIAGILDQWQDEIAETLRQTDLAGDTERKPEAILWMHSML